MADSRFEGLVEPLFRLLSSEHDFARALAAKTLGRIGATGLPAILRASRSDQPVARRGGAQALAIYCQRLEFVDSETAGRQVVDLILPVLLELLRLDDPGVVLMALEAVSKLGAQAGGLLDAVSALEASQDRRIAEKAQRARRAISKQ